MGPGVTPLTVVFVKFVTAVTTPPRDARRDRAECGDGPGSRTYRRTSDARVAAARRAGRRRGWYGPGMVRRAAGQPRRRTSADSRRVARGRRVAHRARGARRPRAE